MSVVFGSPLSRESRIQEERFSSVSSNLPEEKINLDNQEVALVNEHQEHAVAATPISSSNEKYQCDDCQKTFKSSVHFKTHCRNKDPKKCSKCSQVSCTTKQLRKHIQRKHPTFKCSRCDKSFSTGKRLRGHEDIRYWEKTACSLCNTIFCTSKELENHLESIHSSISIEEKNEMVKEVDFMSMSRDEELDDKRKARRLKRTCHICHKMFSKVSQVKRHVLTEHKLTNRKQCDQCPKSFACKSSLEDHVLKKHSIAGTEFNCEKCNKTFDDPLNYSKHKRSHRPALAVKCEYCEAGFNKKSNLNRHLSEVHGYETRINVSKREVFSHPWRSGNFILRSMLI